jgi:NAD(P) transhydrogenase
MVQDRYDLVVIGSGPAGEQGALLAARAGRTVAVVEQAAHLGGAAINTGTIPSKTLRETALYFSGLRQRGLYGIDYSLREGLTVKDFMFRERIVVENAWDVSRQLLDHDNVQVFWGTATLLDAHTVRVRRPTGEVVDLRAEVILIAAGSRPYHPPGVPFDRRLVYDSDTILDMDRIPTTMVVVGGGVIGSEYASIFTALGVQVTLVQRGDRLLPFMDAEISERLRARLEELGLRFLFGQDVREVETAGDRVRLALAGGDALTADIVLFAAGRNSNVEGLGLEKVGVRLGDRGLVLVDRHYRTSVPHIYAAGDVIGFPALASISAEQARIAVAYAFDLPYRQHLAPVFPIAVYTIPEVAMAGLTEEECRAQNIPYVVGRAYYEHNPRGQIIGDLSGMAKLIYSPVEHRVLGVHHIGEQAAELVHIGAEAVVDRSHIRRFVHTVYNYPTLSDLYKSAAYDILQDLETWEVFETLPPAAGTGRGPAEPGGADGPPGTA